MQKQLASVLILKSDKVSSLRWQSQKSLFEGKRDQYERHAGLAEADRRTRQGTPRRKGNVGQHLELGFQKTKQKTN